MKDTERFRRLQWRCRRGMKELDVLLEGFLADQKQQLVRGAWPEMEHLLQSEDDQIWDWLQNPGRREASHFQEILVLIRDGNSSSH